MALDEGLLRVYLERRGSWDGCRLAIVDDLGALGLASCCGGRQTVAGRRGVGGWEQSCCGEPVIRWNRGGVGLWVVGSGTAEEIGNWLGLFKEGHVLSSHIYIFMNEARGSLSCLGATPQYQLYPNNIKQLFNK